MNEQMENNKGQITFGDALKIASPDKQLYASDRPDRDAPQELGADCWWLLPNGNATNLIGGHWEKGSVKRCAELPSALIVAECGEFRYATQGEVDKLLGAKA